MPSPEFSRVPPGQNLLIDADDTLWENNIYFERAIADFISFLNHHHYTPDEVRHVLYAVERENIRTHGYGMHSFAEALVICFEKLSLQPVTPQLHQKIRGIAYQIADHPMEFLPAIEVVSEKDASTYHGVVEKYGLVRDITWMIGNSPKSDINPALEAGLHAVFVPHDNTWMLERDELRAHDYDGRLLQLRNFAG